MPDHWYVDQTTLRILGIGLLMIIAVYLWFCAFAKHRHMTIKGQKLVLPSWKFALTQMLISSVNWMVMGAIIWLLLGQSVNYFFVLGVLLVSSIAGVIVHIPAGIGAQRTELHNSSLWLFPVSSRSLFRPCEIMPDHKTIIKQLITQMGRSLINVAFTMITRANPVNVIIMIKR